MTSIEEIPVYRFLARPLWDSARWTATTFRWHPASEAPPIMGMVFEDGAEASKLFSHWSGSHDELEELRVAVIEGEIPSQRSGYSIHLTPEIEVLSMRTTTEGIVAKPEAIRLHTRLNRMHPLPDIPGMLPRFKQEFEKHQEFLLAPVTRREDGELRVDVELGVVKRTICFREVSGIVEGDIDAVVFEHFKG